MTESAMDRRRTSRLEKEPPKNNTSRQMAGVSYYSTLSFLILCFASQLVQVRSEFDCSTISSNELVNCSCSRDPNGDNELNCPKGIYPSSINAHIAKVKNNQNAFEGKYYVKLQCLNPSDPEDFKLVSSLNIGPIETFILSLCPLPNNSFLSVLNTMGIPKTTKIEINRGNYNYVLKRKHFEGLNEVTQLNLHDLGLMVLPEDLLQDMVDLRWLSLRSNYINNLPKEIFKYNSKLEVLELGSNNLTYLEPGVFRNLTHLRLLNLWGNKLNLYRAVFTDAFNLESLDLSSNSLTTLRPDLFADLGKLKSINLSGNEFVSLPQGLFLNNRLLRRFTMVNNRKSLKAIPSGFLSELEHLMTVDMYGCNISSIPNDTFANSPELTNITLNKNLLTELPEELFRDTHELKSIDISFNLLTKLPDELFKNTKLLLKITANRNQLTTVSRKLFSGLYNLQILDMSNNKLEIIESNAFIDTHNLETLIMSNNLLTLLDSDILARGFVYSPFQNCLKLKVLKLANNTIRELFSDWMFNLLSLELLDLTYNKLSFLKSQDFQFLQDKLTVDLSYNNISIIDFHAAELIAQHQYTTNNGRPLENKSAKILLAGNPLQCDCKIYDLIRYIEGQMAPEVYYLVNIDSKNLTCSGPKDVAGMYADKLSSKALTCLVHEIKNISDKKTCPPKCQCLYRPADSGLIVDCMGANMTSMEPDFLLPTHSLYTHFSKLNHTELYLNNNKLRSLPRILDVGFRNVTKLFLSSNNLTHINVSALSPNLTILELDDNNITNLDSGSVNFLQNSENIKRLSLQNNPWQCDCEAQEMLTFVQAKFKQVEMLNNITCAGGKALIEMSVNDICAKSTVGIISLSITIAILGLLGGLLAALYYRYQQEVKVWLYAHKMFLWWVTEHELDRDKLYDAFISYSHQDEDFVVNKLVPELESGPKPFKLCLHYRDWIVGDWIPNQIARSVEDSRRTIVVLSSNFLDSVWGKMEFRTAHKQALSEGRARVIVIVYEDVGPIDDLDPELRAYISMNTYLKWGDPWFWDRLRYALPHPPELSKGIPMISRGPVKPHNARPILDLDKTDLMMNGTDPNASPPATATPPAETYAVPTLIPNGEMIIEKETNQRAKVQLKV